jgi:CubicO group peptidase (beta-lactamase class C family)
MTAADVQGRIQEAIRELIDSGAETGLQVAVVHDGAVAADAAGGVAVADLAVGCPVGSGTLFWAASTAKGMASTVVHVLAERGELDYDLRVADVWPEFAARGKDTVTVPSAALANRRDLLSADIPSMGTMTARAAATVYAALLGHINAVDLVSAHQPACGRRDGPR